MSVGSKLTSKVWSTLDASNKPPNAVWVSGGIFLQSQKPKGVHNPVLLIFSNEIERTSVNVLSEVFIDFVARSERPGGEGSQLDAIFERADALVNGVFFTTTAVCGTVTRRGMPVGTALYDEEEKDWFLRWRYHAIVKNKQ